MRTGQVSRTAQHNTVFRTVESSLPAGERLFEDPMGKHFLTWPLSAVRPLCRIPNGAHLACRIIDGRWPGVRTSVAARTRLIDDTLEALDDEQLGQLVVLGAGFDTRPYRLPRLRSTPVFEVDHPDTQAAKHTMLKRVLPAMPDNVTFVAIDFAIDSLGETMTSSGYLASRPTVILWEGVTNYLSAEAFFATLDWCARAAPQGMLLFTYVHADVLRSPESFAGARRLHATLNKVGERFTFGLDPLDMKRHLAERSMQLEWDLGSAEYRERYYGARADAMVGHEFYRVALARIEVGDLQPSVPADC
jgi:methyltransferase (TIGR00027 family)